jgi:protein-L-isoaspartate(D-aspartate) O-methyltransferase
MIVDLNGEKHHLIENLKRSAYLKSPRVIEAMKRVPRELFLPPSQASSAYEDHPQSIGHGQTISAPHMNAIMCELLELMPKMKMLELGSGSGYHAALCACLVKGEKQEEDGHIYSIERIPELAEFARNNIEKAGLGGLVTVICKDGTEGLPEHQPYDKILVTAAAPSVPEPIKEQLKIGGRIVIPVGARQFSQDLMVLDRVTENQWEQKVICGVVFVPLIGKFGFS